MNYAYSLEKSRIVYPAALSSAKNKVRHLVDYGVSQFVCPDCFQPVFPKGICSSSIAAHFSHFDKETSARNCPKRASKPSVTTQNRQRAGQVIGKGEYAHAYLACASAFMLQSLFSEISHYCDVGPMLLQNVSHDGNGAIAFHFAESGDILFRSSRLTLESFLSSSMLPALRDISDSIFYGSPNEDTGLGSNTCSLILTPLLQDLLSGLVKEEVIAESDYKSEILQKAYLSMAGSERFSSLRQLIVACALIATFFRYNSGHIERVDNTGSNVVLGTSILFSAGALPAPIRLCTEALICLVTGESEALHSHKNGWAKNPLLLKSIRDRVLRYIHFLRLYSIDTSELERRLFHGANSLRGFIYIAYSPDLCRLYGCDGVVKIGRSVNPLRRENELTGQLLNNPVRIEKSFIVRDSVVAESIVFDRLKGLRIKSSREIFRLSVLRAVEIVQECLSLNGLLMS